MPGAVQQAAAAPGWQDGVCAKGEGITVVVDFTQTPAAQWPTDHPEGWVAHCIAPASGLDAAVSAEGGNIRTGVLKAAGFDFVTDSGLVTGVMGISSNQTQNWFFATDTGDGSLEWDRNPNNWYLNVGPGIDNTNRFAAVTLGGDQADAVPALPPHFSESGETPVPSGGSGGPNSPSPSGSDSPGAGQSAIPSSTTVPSAPSTARSTAAGQVAPDAGQTAAGSSVQSGDHSPGTTASTAGDAGDSATGGPVTAGGQSNESGQAPAVRSADPDKSIEPRNSSASQPTQNAVTPAPSPGNSAVATASSDATGRVWGDDAQSDDAVTQTAGVRPWVIGAMGAGAVGALLWALIAARIHGSDSEKMVELPADDGRDDGEEPW